MLASSFAMLLPFIFLVQCLESIPKYLRQKVSRRNTFRAADEGVRYLKC